MKKRCFLLSILLVISMMLGACGSGNPFEGKWTGKLDVTKQFEDGIKAYYPELEEYVDFEDLTFVIDVTFDDGMIKCTFRADMMQTEWAWGYYYWNGSEILRREDDIYYMVDDSRWREQDQMPLLLLREITVFTERSEESRAITMKPQKVRNVATDNSEWILLEAEDGTRGWIRIEGFGNFPSEKADCFELFENLNMAD